MAEFLYKDLSNKILNTFYEVYNQLGGGFLESVYGNAMWMEFAARGIKCEAQKQIDVYYKGRRVGYFKADMLIEDKIILELKAIKTLLPKNEAQLLNYLRATGIKVGYLLNFGPEPQFKRRIY